ncbi:rhodanese-like domain-containing protein [Chloroflexota bacterium]
MRLKHLAVLMLSLLLGSIVVLASSCAEQAGVSNQIITDVGAREAFEIIQEHQSNPDFIIVDVRTPVEFAEGHIKDAINIDYNSDSFKNEISRLSADKSYLIYCKSGNRSIGALKVMIELGFTEVYHLSTGIIGWLDEGLPIEK